MRRTLVIAGLLALVIAVVLGLGRTRDQSHRYLFQVELASNVAGRVQVYFDVGRGLSEADSSSIPVAAGSRRALITLPLPEGRYQLLRFDPINAPGTVTFAGARITAPDGSIVRRFAATDFQPNAVIARYQAHGGVATMQTAPGADDPNLTHAFSRPLVLRSGWTMRLRVAASRIGMLFVGWLVGLVGVAAAWRQRTRIRAYAGRHPHAALWVLSALAGIVACYPVVFLGKSFVSPNTTPLLHASPPTVPGYTDLRTTNLHVNDPAVVLWQNVPYSVAEYRALLRDHELPLWDRYVSCGVTLIGQGQSMLGDPLHLLVIAAGGASWAWDIKFVLARILFAAGLAFTVLAFTADLPAAAILTLAAPFVGFFNYRFNHPAVFSLAYAPWILCAWALLIRAGDTRRMRGPLLLLVVANVAVLGSGTVKEAYALLLVLNAAGAASWILTSACPDRSCEREQVAGPAPSERPAHARSCGKPWLHAAAIVLTLICTAAITAPLWLPFFENLRLAHTSYAKPVVWQAPRAWLVGLFDSLFYLELNSVHRQFLPSANFLVLLGFAFAVLQSPARLRRAPHLWVMLAALVGSVLLAFEFIPARWIAATPLLRSIYHVHNTFCVVAVVLLSALAGCGFHVARRRLQERHPWRPLALAAALLVVLLVIFFHDLPSVWSAGPGFIGWVKAVPAHPFFYGNLLLMLAGCGTLAWAARRRLRTGRTSAGAAIIAAAALAALLYRHGLHVDFGFAEDYLTFPMVRADLATPSPALEAARREAGGEPFRIVGTDTNLINGWNTVYGLESINGPDAMMNRRYRELAEATGLAPTADWRFPISPAALGQDRPVLDFLNVRYVVSNVPDVPAATGYTRAGSYDLELYRSATAWPRAFFTNRVQHYTTLPELVALIRADSGRPFAAIQAGDTGATKAAGAAASRFGPVMAVVPAGHYRLTANTTAFSIRAPGPGVAVLQETWLPRDFRVTVNGKTARYFRVNHAFKAVALPRAGEYRIRVSYWPEHFTLALWLSAVGLVGLLTLLAAPRPNS